MAIDGTSRGDPSAARWATYRGFVYTAAGFLSCPVTAGRVTGPGPLDAALQEPVVVGRCPEVQVSIRERTVPCVLDTGSQVTLFSQFSSSVILEVKSSRTRKTFSG